MANTKIYVKAAPKFTRAFDVITFQRRIMTMVLRDELNYQKLSSLNGSCKVILNALEMGNQDGDYVVRIKKLETIVIKLMGSKRGRKLLQGLV